MAIRRPLAPGGIRPARAFLVAGAHLRVADAQRHARLRAGRTKYADGLCENIAATEFDMTQSGGGYGLTPDEIPRLKKILEDASDALGMNDFDRRATLEGSLTVEEVQSYGNAEETVKEKVLKLTEFCNNSYPHVVDAMRRFIARTHVTIVGAAEGVAKSGDKYQASEEDATRWLNEHEPK
jgi:hypothetical protein